jgi:pimeloyl-ACP methyl ester carboxylesterase
VHPDRVERLVDVAPGVRLWAEDVAGPGEPLLLVMDADASGRYWPDALVARLAERHHVILYDHRDTGRSTWAFDDQPYSVGDLAVDAVMVLDAFAVSRAHVVGTGMGGEIAQLLLLDHPDRLLSATLLASTVLGGNTALPGPDPALVRMWAEVDDPRDDRAELAWRVTHRELLCGPGVPFDLLAARALEQRVIDHTGHHLPPSAHVHAERTGPERAAELATVAIPTLVVEAPDDPVLPPPHAEHLARAIPGARLVRVPGMGHAITPDLAAPLAATVLDHTTAARGVGQRVAQRERCSGRQVP